MRTGGTVMARAHGTGPSVIRRAGRRHSVQDAPRVEQAPRVERPLDRAHRLDGRLAPLADEPVAPGGADPVLAGHRAAERQRGLEQLGRARHRACAAALASGSSRPRMNVGWRLPSPACPKVPTVIAWRARDRPRSRAAGPARGSAGRPHPPSGPRPAPRAPGTPAGGPRAATRPRWGPPPGPRDPRPPPRTPPRPRPPPPRRPRLGGPTPRAASPPRPGQGPGGGRRPPRGSSMRSISSSVTGTMPARVIPATASPAASSEGRTPAASRAAAARRGAGAWPP